MQVTDTILTEYRANTRHFDRGARIYDRTLAKQERLTNDRLTRIDRRWERSTRSILASRTALVGLTGVVGGAALVQLRAYSEEWRNVERRLESIGVTSAAAQQGLIDLAIRTRSSVNGTAAAVQRMAKSTGDGIDVTTRRVETLQKLLAAGGASGTERASVSLQLGQALQSGVLSGDEFRSIRENAPVEFLDALARAAGVTRQELKKFAEDQRLTTEVVLEALDGLASSADQKFKQLAVSGDEAISVLTSGLIAYVGKVDQTLGATASLNGAMVFLGEYMAGVGEGAETMAAAIQVAGAVALATAGSRGIGALSKSLQKSAEVRQSVVRSTQDQVAASRTYVTQARRELDAANARQRAARLDLQTRQKEGRAIKKAAAEAARADRAQAKAAVALSGAHQRAAATARAHALAQNQLSAAYRLGTASVRAFNGVMAFFGGPIGLAITSATLLVSVLGQMDTQAERVASSLDDLSGTIDNVRTVNETLGGDYAALEQANDNLTAAIKRGGEAAVTAATLEVNSIRKRINANEKYREELSALAKLQLAEAKRNLAELERQELESARTRLARQKLPDNYRGATADRAYLASTFTEDALRVFLEAERQIAIAAAEAGKELTDQQKAAFDAAREHSEAAVKVEDLTNQVEVLTAAAPQLKAGLDDASAGAANLAKTAAGASQGIAALIAQIPDLKKAAQIQSELAKNATARDEALRGAALIPDLGERESEIARIEELFAKANDAVTGLDAKQKDAAKSLKDYTEAARIGDLSAREQALAREAAKFDELSASLKGAKASQEELNAAQSAYESRQAQINADFDTRDTKAGRGAARDHERDLAAARELLANNGQRALYIEQQLNRERARLRELLPDLISLGLSRADAEKLIAEQLETTKERLAGVKSASEEATESFAKNLLRDVQAADDLTDAIGRISSRLLELATDSAFDRLAEQFAKLSAAAGGSGILGKLVNAVVGSFGIGPQSATPVKASTGGLIRGPGTSTSDSIPAWLSDEEFVVRAKSVTPETLPFLEAINRGARIPKFASGGLVGGGRAAAAVMGAPVISIHNAPQGNHQVRQSPNGEIDIILDRKIDQRIEDKVYGPKGTQRMAQKFGIKPKAQGG